MDTQESILQTKIHEPAGLVSPVNASPTKAWWRLLDAAWFLILSGFILFTVSRHEPWADEAQSWLLARDLGWFRLIFGELRYEGHPGLWHSILWFAIHFLHLPYAAFGYIGATFAIAGIGVLLWAGPFPRPLRYLVASSFFLSYQYAVVARSYNLVALLSFSAAALLTKEKHLLKLAFVLALLAQVSVHGIVVALGLAVVCGERIWTQWAISDSRARKRAWAAGLIFATSLLLVAIEVYPPHEQTVGLADASTLTFEQHLQKAFDGLGQTICTQPVLSFLLLLVTGIWCLERRRLMLLLTTVGGLTFIYGFLRGTSHHQGLILIGLLVSLWVAWPTAEESGAATHASLVLHRSVVGIWLVVFALQSYWTWTAIRNDWHGKYSVAQDVATFLKEHHAEQRGCYAYNYWTIAVQPYFDHNIFPNLVSQNAGGFFHNSEAYSERTEFQTESGAGWSTRMINPECVLVAYPQALDMTPLIAYAMDNDGYNLSFAKQGNMYSKDGVEETDSFFVFERRPEIPEQRFETVP